MRKYLPLLFGLVVCAVASLCYMARPSFGIVYATKSKMVLRIILPDSNAELYEQPLRDGESILVVANASAGDAYECGKRVILYACERLVETATGVKPLNSRHAVIDVNNKVVAIDLLDPALDGSAVHPGMTLVQSDDAEVGMTYSPSSGFSEK